ncbi:putative ribonuclease H-like domain-containing protein [Tanacetum coccineum]
MRTKPGVDSLSFDDLYNNLRVFESDVKGFTASSSSIQNVAFVSENTSSTNDVSTAYGVSNSSGHNSQYEHTSTYSLLANQSSCPQLDHEDLEQLDEQGILLEIGDPWGIKMGGEEMLRTLRIRKKTMGEDLVNIRTLKLWFRHRGQLWYEEKIRFMKIDLDDKTDVLTYHKKLLAEAEKEKEDLKAKVEKWHNSSKNLNILLNSQMSARDKAGLGYGDQLNKGVLSYENEVFQSVFVSRTSDIEDSHVNDRYAEGMHAVPPPMTGIYIPSGPDKEIDDSQFTYGPKQSKPSESDARSSDFNSCESNCSEETHESMPEPVVNEPKVVSQPKVWSDAPIIEEYESDSEDEHVSLPTKEQEIPSFAFINTDKHVKTPRQTVKEQNTCSQSPKPDKKDCSGLMSKKLGLGYGFTKKACFVCGSFSHLIRDCDFHEKRMAKQAELNNRMTVLTRTGKIPVNTARTSGTNTVNTARHNFNRQAVPINAARKVNTVKPIVNNTRPKAGFHKSVSPFRKSFNSTTTLRTKFSKQKVNTAKDYPHRALQNKGIVDSRCFRHMTGNKAYLTEYQDFNGSPVAFEGKLQHFNLFSVAQIYDKKNKVLFTDSECLVLSPEFKLPDENQVLLRIPRQNNMYSFNLKNIVPSVGLACLIAKATIDESNKWHRRLGHVKFKNLNKLVKGNLVRGLPSKIFQNDHTCVACQKGKQHKASCKAKTVSSISQPLQLLHMDLFGPTFVRSLNHKTYCLVITEDFNRSKGIKREYSNARTLQQNRVAERKNMTLIEVARTMLAYSFLPNTFWAEAVSTACYVLNRVLVTKPQNKTPYELITGKIPIISYIRPFGCHVTILNTIDHLGKFYRKSDEGFLVGYSLQSKAFRVYNLETKRVEENLHITFLKNKPNVAWKGPTWLFDLDYLTDSMNYQPMRSENQANKHAGPQEANHNVGTEDNIDAGDSEIEVESAQDYFVLPIWSSYNSTVKSSKENNAGEEPTKHPDLKPVDKEDQVLLDELERLKRQEQDANDAAEALRKEFSQETKDLLLQARTTKASSTNIVNTTSTPVSIASPYGRLSFTDLTNADQDDSEIPALEEIYDNPTTGIFTNPSYDDEGAVADFTNLETIVNVSPIPTSRINSIHPSTLILRDPKSAVQTRSKVTKSSGAHAFVSYIQKQRRNNHKDFQHCLFACFLSQNEHKKISEALEDENLPYGNKAIETKWVYKNKKDERGVVVRNKARLVAQGHRQEKGIDYDEVFATVARIEAIRIFLAFASCMGFIVYQMDVKSAFLYGKIDEEVYVSQPPGFIDPKFPKKTLFIKKDKHDIILVQVYVDDIIFGSTKKSWCDEFEALMKSRFQMSSMGELTFFLGLQVKQKEDGIFISQDKYVVEILKKFDFVSVKTASTPIETQKPLVKDEEASDVDVHLYRSMIGSLMYLTASRPDIMFAVCACSRFQVNPKTSHLSVVKRIFRYLKGKPKLGLWYPRVSSFDLEAYSDSDYAGANLDRKSTTGDCQFLGRRLISWQCKKQIIVATSTTEAEYVAAANCCGQVLWIQNQMLDYGFNFMNTKIYIDNESTICIVKNPVYHSKTKHIAIRHHFIRDAYEKKLI